MVVILVLYLYLFFIVVMCVYFIGFLCGAVSLQQSSGRVVYGEDEQFESAIDSLLQGTVGENNRHLRRQIIDARKKRDAYMQARFAVLEPFLPTKNYFQRKKHSSWLCKR